ncbi:Spy/CpxP family protein refolding chaperone [Caulobacter endophyticus]|uniref:Spy/CpxP family protein refolding chaperone n=1 Tax=Caulobacter endophyticus TaxID=2172652 RepID=UPI0024106A59|nr:Spy/CpxP family protein refolding chaperone [Caulobacter endophyticus]MDG2529852.1 Spy/CpxP family protein refolding chaperone [Caulobacter endophyticus]
MRLVLKSLTLAAGAALAAGVVAASAQPAAPPPPPAPPEAPEPPPPPPSFDNLMFRGHPGPGAMAFRMHQDPEARAQRLRDVLQLTDRQDGALKAYIAATGPKERPEPRPARDESVKDKAPPTALERLDEQAERMAKVAADLKGRADATRSFYNALTPSQKKAFDALGPEVTGAPNVTVRRFETRGPKAGFGERRVIIQRKSGS